MSNYHDDDGTFSGGFFMALLLIGGICLGYWVRDSGITFKVDQVKPITVNQRQVKP